MNRGLMTVLALLSVFPGAALAAEIEIVSLDDPNEGLNDASPRSPEGGNFGSTLGAQRRNALEFVAGVLGDRLQSQVPIRVSVRFDDLECESDRANLGQAGPAILVSDFPNAPEPGVVYPIALARALAGERLLEGDDLAAVFNDRLDAGTGCVGGNRWYYGLDGNAPEGTIDFAPVAAHELVHGLGFVSFVDPESGKLLQDENGIEFPDIFSSQILDRSLGALWPDLTDAQRRDSVTNGESVVWAGATC